MKTNARHNRPWTPHDLRTMKQKARARASSRQTAKTLRRSQGAVKYKAMVEGIRFHNIEQPRGVQKRLHARKRRGR